MAEYGVDGRKENLGGREAATVHGVASFRRILDCKEEVQLACLSKDSEDCQTDYRTALDTRVQCNGAAWQLSRKLDQKPREAEVLKWTRKYSVAYNSALRCKAAVVIRHG